MNNLTYKENDVLKLNDNEEYIISGKGKLTLEVVENANVKVLLKEPDADVEVNLGKYSHLTLNQINFNESNNLKNVNQDESSSFEYVMITNNASSEDLFVNLNGYKASCDIKYLTIEKNNNANFKTYIKHNAKETNSNVYNVGVSLGDSGIDFNTTGKINKGMSKSVCKQLSRGIINGEKSFIKSFPILLIDEYDVSANHGTAIGKMSDYELFYLMSRGLSKIDAYKLILSGLINPFIDSFWNEDIKDSLKSEMYKEI